MYPPKHTLARGGADLRVNRARGHVHLHVNKRSRTCRDGGDTDLRVSKDGHIDLHVNNGSRACREGGDTDLRVNRAHAHLDLHVIKGP